MLIITDKSSSRIEINDDERVGLVGRNGSGKTTLIMSALCINPGRFEAYIDGEDFCKIRDYRILTGILQDTWSQFFQRNCRDELILMSQYAQVDTTIGERIMGKYYTEDFFKLSDGYRRRYAIACSLALKPKYLLLDEPYSNLDKEASEELNRLIPNGSLIAEHRIRALRELVDRVYLIEDFVVKEIDKDKLYDDNFLISKGLRGFKLPKLDTTLGNTLLDVNVNSIRIRVREGEVLCVVGRNGAGKTTLLRKLRGKIYVIFQNPNLEFFNPTVREEVGSEEALRLFKLEHLKDRSPFTLSYGEKMRVLIATAYASKSKVIGLDEPSVGLDGIGLQALYEMVKLLVEEKRGLIITTHDEDILQLCTTTINLG
ncbi:MAG: ATP-binding cassette domain-containing protein [Sulfolobaceae archaeon]|nr:ATP-binding cassette domain-containing protein [Sulfolobaceae archaeon]